MKTYVITLSKTFPKTHRRAGEPTNFRTLFETGVKKTYNKGKLSSLGKAY